MHRLSAIGMSAIGAGVFAAAIIVASTPADAGMPRGAVLSADEQTGDDTTGTTIARGNAVITIPEYAISGNADVIEVWPKRNEILLKGRANLTVGRRHYASDTVLCTLDFDRCSSTAADAADPQPAALLSEPPVTAATTPW